MGGDFSSPRRAARFAATPLGRWLALESETGGRSRAARARRRHLRRLRPVVDGTFSFPEIPAGRWQGTARGNRTQLVAESVEARLLGGRLAGSARVRWKPAVTWSVNATAYGIDPHATWEVVPAALSGGAWRVVGHGDERSMVVESLRVDNPQGALIATGGFAWKPGFTCHADATTRGISPAALFPEVPAELAGGDWHVIGRGTDARAELSRLDGSFLGGMVPAAGTVAWEPGVSGRRAPPRATSTLARLQGGAGNLGAPSAPRRDDSRRRRRQVLWSDRGTTARPRVAAHGTIVLREETVRCGRRGHLGRAAGDGGEISPQIGLARRAEIDLGRSPQRGGSSPPTARRRAPPRR